MPVWRTGNNAYTIFGGTGQQFSGVANTANGQFGNVVATRPFPLSASPNVDDRIMAGVSPAGNRWYRTVTANNSGGAAKADWPIRIELTSANFSWAQTRADGADITATSTDGSTIYPCWVEKWDVATQLGTVWVKFPTLGAGGSATARLYYGREAVGIQSASDVFTFAETFSGPESIRGSFDDASGFFAGNHTAHPNPIVQASGTREQSNVVFRESALAAERYTFLWTQNDQIYVAFSPDGETYTHYSGNPVFAGAEDPYVVLKVDGSPWKDSQGRMYVYFERKGGGSSQDDTGVARTANFKNWEMWTGSAWSTTLTTSGNILPRGSSGAWDELFTASPTVVHDGTQFVMLYEGSTNALLYKTGVAFSSDGISWTKGTNNPIFNLEVIDEVIKIGSTWWGFGHEAGYFVHRWKSTLDPGSWDSASAWTIDDPMRWGDGGSSLSLYHDGSKRLTYYPPVLGQASDKMELLDPLGGSTWKFKGNGPGGTPPTNTRVQVENGTLTFNNLNNNAQVIMATKNDALFGANIAVRFRHKRGSGAAARYAQVAIGNGALTTTHPLGTWSDGVSMTHGSDDILRFEGYTGGTNTGTIASKTAPYGFDPAVSNTFEIQYRTSNDLELFANGVSVMWGQHNANKDTTKGVLISSSYTTTQEYEFIVVRKFDGVDPSVSVGDESPLSVWTSLIGRVSEIDEVVPLSKRLVVGQVVGANIAQPIARSRTKQIAQAAETDTANVAAVVVPFVVTGYRFRNDDGNETTATWKAATNTPVFLDNSQPFRLRVTIKNDSAVAVSTQGLFLEVSADGGSWAPAGSGVAVVPTSSAVVNDGTTTQQISSGGFTAGRLEETPSTFGLAPATTVGAGNSTEYEWVLITGTLGGINSVAIRVVPFTGSPFESDNVPTFTHSQVMVIGQATESDSPTAVLRAKNKAVQQPSENDSAFVIVPDSNAPIIVGQVVEVDTSQSVVRKKTKIISQVGVVSGLNDSFNRADSSVTMGTADSGQTWTYPQGTWGISSNRAYSVTDADNDIAVLDTGATDQTVSAKIAVLGAAGYHGVLARVSTPPADFVDYYLADTNGAVIRLFSRVDGTYTELSVPVNHAVVAGDTLELSVIGSAVVVKANGTTIHSVTNTALTTGTKAGLRIGNGAVGARWDDFSVAGSGSASEVSHPIAHRKSRTLAQLVETDFSFPITRLASQIPVGQALETQTSQPIVRRKTKVLGQALEASTSHAVLRAKTKAVAQVTQPSVAQTVARSKVRIPGQVVETNLAQVVSRSRRKTLTQPSETSSTFLIGRSKQRTLVQPVETDTVTVIGRSRVKTLSLSSETDAATRVLLPVLVRQAVETDLARPVSTTMLQVLLQVAEADTAQAMQRLRSRVLAQISETSTAQALARQKSKGVLQAAETEVSQALQRRKVRLLGQAVESETSQSLARAKQRALGASLEADTTFRVARARGVRQAVESDSVTNVTRRKAKVLLQTTEADTTTSLARRKLRLVQLASEADQTFLVAHPKQRSLTQISETSVAQTVLRRATKALLLTSETSTSQPVAHSKRRTTLQAVETSTSQAIVRGGYGFVLGQATELDTARIISRAPSSLVGQATATDSALSITKRKVVLLGQVVESDAPFTLLPRRSRVVQAAAETDTAAVLTPSTFEQLSQPSETDTATFVARRKIKVVAQVVETNFAQSTRPNNDVPIGQPSTSEVAFAITPSKSVAVGRVVEGSTSLQIGRFKVKEVGLASESGASHSVSTRKARLTGLATEVSIAFSIGVLRGRVIGQATEQSYVFQIIWPDALPIIPIPSLPVGIMRLASEPVTHVEMGSDTPGTIRIASAPVPTSPS